MATKRDHIKTYLQNIMQLDSAIKVYQDQKKDLKKNFSDNAWLTKSEQKLVDQALRMIKQEVDPEALSTITDHVKRELGMENDVENNSSSSSSDSDSVTE